MSLTTAREWFQGDQGAHQHWKAFRLPALTSSVAAARHRVCDTLGRWDMVSVRDDAGLVISELFTNAVLHTDSERITCALWTVDEVLYVEVADDGHTRTTPTSRPPTSDLENGRGLLLVEELTDEWGVRPSEPGHGRTVWARLICAGLRGGIPAQARGAAH
jgi:serine/threonine-protein kinase RsbW